MGIVVERFALGRKVRHRFPVFRAGELALENERCIDQEDEDDDGTPVLTDRYKRMLLERAAELGDAIALRTLSLDAKDHVRFRRAASLGECTTLEEVARACEGADEPTIRALAAQCYRRLEELPVLWHPDCASIWVKIGLAYETGDGVLPLDLRRAAAMFARLANNRYSSHHLGRLLRDGRGVPRNLARARELFAFPFEEDDAFECNDDARLLLAYSCLYGGEGVEVDLPRAKRSFLRYFDLSVSASRCALWDFILFLLRTNQCTEAVAWASEAFNGTHTFDFTSLDSIEACEALLAIIEGGATTGSVVDPNWRVRGNVEKALGKSLGFPADGGCAGELPRAPPLDCLWVSRCGHVTLDAIAAAAFSASGSCPRGCAIGAPVTWTEKRRPFVKPDLFDSAGFKAALDNMTTSTAELFAAKEQQEKALRACAQALFSAEPALQASSSLHICAWPPCVKTAPLKCGRCSVAYCSPACQRAHWRDHKRSCAAGVAEFASAAAAAAPPGSS